MLWLFDTCKASYFQCYHELWVIIAAIIVKDNKNKLMDVNCIIFVLVKTNKQHLRGLKKKRILGKHCRCTQHCWVGYKKIKRLKVLVLLLDFLSFSVFFFFGLTKAIPFLVACENLYNNCSWRNVEMFSRKSLEVNDPCSKEVVEELD